MTLFYRSFLSTVASRDFSPESADVETTDEH